MTRLTDEQLNSMEQWAACDLREGEGREVQEMVDEIRELRAVASAARAFIAAQDPLACGDFAGDKFEDLRRVIEEHV